MKQKLIRTYMENGVVVKVYEAAPPRKSEIVKTYKYSIANIGHQATKTGKCNFFASV